MVKFELDGSEVEVVDDGGSLLGALRDRLGNRSVKDGCSPQGQCGCCTVLVDGDPRVACVTPLRRISGRHVTTVEGLTGAERSRWVDAFLAHGASQCGFCTPGIVCRLVGHERRGADLSDRQVIDRALAAHLCRCTGWQTIREAASSLGETKDQRDLDAATRQATLETGSRQIVSEEVVLGQARFADDTAPQEASVAVRGRDQVYVAQTLHEARQLSGKVQGRRSTLGTAHPLLLPEGDWALMLRTSWVEPAYLETDASWCRPDGDPADPIANGGAFGGKARTDVNDIARDLAQSRQNTIRYLWSREDSVKYGVKRPPIAAGMRSDGSGVIRVVKTEGINSLIRSVLPDCEIEEVEVQGPPTSSMVRGSGWVEAEMLKAGLRGQTDWITSPTGASARAAIGDGRIRIEINAGTPIDWVMFRSYCIGAAHMAYSWVTSESLSVDEDGEVHDLTIRSFGILNSANSPEVEVISVGDGPAIAAGDAVFAAVAASAWLNRGCPVELPAG